LTGHFAEGAGLNYLFAIFDMRKPKAAADQETVAEEGFYLSGMRAGGNVEILGSALQEQIPHPASDKVCDVIAPRQAIQNFKGVWINISS
jgi:hypothetical protein